MQMRFLTTTILALGWAVQAHAQTVQEPQSPQASRPARDDQARPDRSAPSSDDIVVTGSRIGRPNLDQPTPVSTLGGDAIMNKGSPILGDAIAQLPGVGFRSGVRGNAYSFSDQGGLDLVDLHDLGAARTLTLVDGKRHVGGSSGSTAVDLSSIPPALVDRVEVITGGASAIYGSDAVSGVVNVITKRNFDGIALDAQSGVYQGGFGAAYSGNLLVGKNAADGRGNFTFSAFASRQQQIRADDIDSFRPHYGRILNPADLNASGRPISGNGIPNYLIVPGVGINITNRTGVLLNSAFAPVTTFDAAGNLASFPARTGRLNAAFGTYASDCTYCYHLGDYLSLVPPIERFGAAVKAYRDVGDVRLTLDAKFVQTRVVDALEPAASIGDYQLSPDNAFITPALRALLSGTSAANYPLISRFLEDLGRETYDTRRRTYRVVAGAEGRLDAGIAELKWDASVNYGVTETRIDIRNLLLTDNFANAIDSVRNAAGQAVCRTGGNCVAYNPFGFQNGQAAIDYVRTDAREDQKLTQAVVDINLGFDTGRFLRLPGGPISIAAGGEYRRETSRLSYDTQLTSGITDFGSPVPVNGRFDVYEGYVEAEAPLAKDLPLLRELTLSGAVRQSQYSTVGGVTAWKLGGLYAPVTFLKLRGTLSTAVRAPNITEAFLPATGGFTNVNDPCDVSAIGLNAQRTANCAAAGVPTGFSQGSTNVASQTTGNPNLSPETSRSFTAGIVFQPARNFSVTADYFNIRIRDAITLVSGQNIANLCYDAQGGINNPFCALLARNSTTSRLTLVSTAYVNAARLQTNGIDAQVNYNHSAPGIVGGTGRVALGINGTYVFRLRNYPFQDNPTQVTVLEGTVGRPQFKALGSASYDDGVLRLNWQTRFVGRVARFSRDPGQAAYEELFDHPYLGNRFYHNVALSYRIDPGKRGMELTLGVNNLLDTAPPLYSITSFGTDAIYDLGRYVFAGVKVRL